MLPAAQVVGPVYPVPPHCPYFATVPALPLPLLPLALVVVDPPLPAVVVLALVVELDAAPVLV